MCAVAAALSCLGVLSCSAASHVARPATPRPAGRAEKARLVEPAGSLASCEPQLEGAPRRLPVLAVAGASVTAGVGPDSTSLSWAVRLARALRWDALIYGVAGAGYVRAGAGDRGPALRMLAREHLAALHPALVILQFGHDDIGVPRSVERRHVDQVIAYIRAQAPGAEVALLTVFTAGHRSAAAWRADRAIVSAATTADSRVIIMDPLAGGWTFRRSRAGGLHPSSAGDAQIAAKVASILARHGVRPAASGDDAPVICASGGPAGSHSGPAGAPGTGGRHAATRPRDV